MSPSCFFFVCEERKGVSWGAETEIFSLDISAWSAEILPVTLTRQNCKEVNRIPSSYAEKQTSVGELEVFAKVSCSEAWKKAAIGDLE